jgi:hypothetical protein
MKINQSKHISVMFTGNGKFIKEQLKANLGNIDNYWNGDAFCLTDKGVPLSTHISPVDGKEGKQIKKWFKIAGQNWEQWWLSAIKGKEKGINVFKLESENKNKILGLIALHPNFLDLQDNRITTWSCGLRVAPEYSDIAVNKEIKGIGNALINHLLIKSCKVNDDGIALNSTIGKEGFFKKSGLNSSISMVPGKTKFYLKEDEEILKFLMDKLGNYKRLSLLR